VALAGAVLAWRWSPADHRPVAYAGLGLVMVTVPRRRSGATCHVALRPVPGAAVDRRLALAPLSGPLGRRRPLVALPVAALLGLSVLAGLMSQP
jgi:hypothetical protein